MDLEVIIPIVGALAVTLGVTLYHYGYLKATPKPKDRRTSSRQGGRRTKDKLQLTPAEKRMYGHAQSLVKQGKFIEGANLLENIGDFRGAISTLEANGFPIEAGNILLRMGIPNRAGALLARNGKWVEAAEAFIAAKADLEAAKSYYNAGRYVDAAKLFELVGQGEAAGDALYKGEAYKASIEQYIKAGKGQKAFKALKRVLRSPQKSIGPLDHNNAKVLLDIAIKVNDIDDLFVSFLAQEDLIIVAITELLKEGRSSEVARVLKQENSEFELSLIQSISDEASINRSLAQAFESNHSWNAAGMIHKRLNQFQHAGRCFEKANDLERASYCYERAGMKDKATQLRKEDGSTPPPAQPSNSESFKQSDEMATKVLPMDSSATLPETPNNRFSLNEASVTASRLDSIGKSALPNSIESRFFNKVGETHLHAIGKLLNYFECKADEDLSFKLKHQFLLIFNGEFSLQSEYEAKTLTQGAFVGDLPGCQRKYNKGVSLKSVGDGYYGTINLESLDELMQLNKDLAILLLRNTLNESQHHAPSATGLQAS